MTPFVQNVTDILSFGIILGDLLAVFLLLVLVTPLKRRGWGKAVYDFFGENAVLFSFMVALVSIIGSLFYSEFAGFQPCLLCWWARILLFPQALILLIALIKNDERVRTYCIALCSIGVILTTYHTYLQFGGESVLPCAASGVGCEHVYFVEYGYITLPTMALTAFALILLFCLFKRKEA